MNTLTALKAVLFTHKDSLEGVKIGTQYVSETPQSFIQRITKCDNWAKNLEPRLIDSFNNDRDKEWVLRKYTPIIDTTWLVCYNHPLKSKEEDDDIPAEYVIGLFNGPACKVKFYLYHV